MIPESGIKSGCSIPASQLLYSKSQLPLPKYQTGKKKLRVWTQLGALPVLVLFQNIKVVPAVWNLECGSSSSKNGNAAVRLTAVGTPRTRFCEEPC